MRAKGWLSLGGCLVMMACPSNGGDDGNVTTMQGTQTTGGDDTSTGDPGTSTEPPGTSTGVAESSTGQGDSSTGEACPPDAECTVAGEMCANGGTCVACSCFGGNLCDPIIPGEWNSCHDEQGQTDNTLCNWMGTGGATGFIGCLNSAMMDGSNVCFISGCVDTCDCFAPPTTGTAEVICAEILADGGMGCALDCSGGKTCPDGMVCQNDTCFWPPPA